MCAAEPSDGDPPLGAPVDLALPLEPPQRSAMAGRHATLSPADPAHHAADLHAAFAEDRDGRNWAYLPYGPFATAAEFGDWMAAACLGADPLFFTVLVAERPVGLASYLRIAPDAASIEIGHLHFAPSLQRTPASTEAIALMMGAAFDLRCRRVEWKCNALNRASCRAAERLGFTYEGTHRQASVVKGRNRDTAWYSVLDSEWPVVSAGFATWLGPENFAPGGQQRRRLEDCR